MCDSEVSEYLPVDRIKPTIIISRCLDSNIDICASQIISLTKRISNIYLVRLCKGKKYYVD